jgi:hypothetical protein
MTPEEKKIEELCRTTAGFDVNTDPNDYYERYFRHDNARIYDACINVIKSDAAKEYHTKGMFTLSDFLTFGEYCFNNETNQSEFGIVMREWFNNKTK